MNCREADELLSAYIDGELSQEERKSLEEHISQCSQCAGAVRELKAVKDALRAATMEEVPAGLHGRIMQAVRGSALKCDLEEFAGRQGQEDRRAVPGEKTRRDSFFGRFIGVPSAFAGYRRLVPAIAAMMVFVIFASIGGTLLVVNWRGGDTEQLAGRGAADGIADESTRMKSLGMPSPEAAESKAPPGAGIMDMGKSSPGAPTVSSQNYGSAADSYGALGDIDRRIIKNGQMNIQVAQGMIPGAAQKARDIVVSNQGFIESSSLTRVEQGDKEVVSYYMSARIPAPNLEKTMEEMSAMGTVLRNDTSSQDVTDQYIDISARLKNKEAQEQRLLQIMGEAKTVGELMQVESELSRVRGEIESMKGQLQYYDKVTTMSGLSLWISEEGSEVKPPSPWDEVWKAFVNAWKNLALFLVRILPGALIIGIGVALVCRIMRKTPGTSR